MKPENSFIADLEKKTQEQQKLVETEVMPGWARGLGIWLGVHPWRVIVPLSGLLYVAWRITFGVPVRELILGLFGGFR